MSEQTSSEQSASQAFDPRSVECPECHAAVGEPCQTMTGRNRIPHMRRSWLAKREAGSRS